MRVVRKLEAATRQAITQLCNSSERFQDMNPHDIVPLRFNEDVHLESVSTFYWVLKAENLAHNRSNTRLKNSYGKPPERRATELEQV